MISLFRLLLVCFGFGMMFNMGVTPHFVVAQNPSVTDFIGSESDENNDAADNNSIRNDSVGDAAIDRAQIEKQGEVQDKARAIPRDSQDTTEQDIKETPDFADLLPPLAVGSVPEQVADNTIRAWQTKAEEFDYFALASSSPQQMCLEFSQLGQYPDMIREARVNFADRRLLKTETINSNGTNPHDVRIYSYPVGIGDRLLARAEVLVTKSTTASSNKQWQGERVSIKMDDNVATIPAFFKSNAAGLAFIVLTLYVFYLLVRPSWYRRLLEQGWSVLLGHRRIVLLTVAMLYGMYILGSLSGLELPECQYAITALVTNGLSEIGIDEVLVNNNIPQTAAAITYWNFIEGALSTTLFPASLLAVPAYFLNLSRFYVMGFALAPTGPQAGLMFFHLPVILVELLAYILITAGGGILLATVVRQGFKAFGLGMKKLFLLVPIAFLLLLVSAWYESIEMLWLLPRLMGL